MFLFWQQAGGLDAWQEGLAAARATLIATKKPRYVTVLDVSAIVHDTSSQADVAGLKYIGPAYFDWDCEDIDRTLTKFRQFLDKLRALDVDLRAVKLYATGGRGFHAELPMGLFLPKIPKGGVQSLPGIYKEMAFELYTDTLDLRVYSGRKGRMWRTPNVERENGRFKVPLTVAEALNMKAEDYEVLCSTARSAPEYAAPELNQGLAVMYAKAEVKVAEAVKRRKNSVKDVELLAKFKGDYPPTIMRMMLGEGIAEGIGFHPLAMQIAITSNALGKKEEEMLAASAGLIEKHVSDGSRYNTPAKRTAELMRMFRYTQDNVCYTYSKGAVKSLVDKDQPTADLDGLSDGAAKIATGADNEDDGLMGGVYMAENGIYKSGEKGARRISDLVFKDVHMLTDAVSKNPQGFTADITVQGEHMGRHEISGDTFMSRTKFQSFAGKFRGVITGQDNDVSAISIILRDTARMNEDTYYVLSREGVELVQRPDTKEDIQDIMWVTHKQVLSESPVKYVHVGSPTKDGIYKSDLMDAPDFKDSPETRATLDAMLRMNTPFVVASLVGWAVSCFLKPVYQHIFSQFPLCGIYGQSGAGKTTTLEVLEALFYYRSPPLELQADGATRFMIEGALVSTGSIPCILDEYKPRTMRPGRHEQLRQFFRAAYNCGVFGKGGMSTDLGSTWRDLRTFSVSAPVLFAGEALEAETAILERTVTVPMSKSGLDGRREHGEVAKAGRRLISTLGRELVRATFRTDLAQFKDQVETNRKEALSYGIGQSSDRPAYNLAVVLTGLDFLGKVLRTHCGTHFDEQLAKLRTALKDVQQHASSTVMPEASKVMNALSFMSRTEDPGSEFGLRFGVDFVITKEGHLDMAMQNCYIKYATWSKRKSQVALYDTEDAFVHGLKHYGPVMDRMPADSVLKDKSNGLAKVFRFDGKKLTGEGVESFKH